MNLLKLFKEMLIVHEGYREKLYKDSEGIWTIGIGYNIQEHGLPPNVIESLFIDQAGKTVAEANKHPFYGDLDDIRKLVVLDMLYNLGANRFNGFKKMIKALEVKDYETASVEMLDSKWAAQVGVRAERLSYMMKTGKLHSDFGGEE